MSHAEYKSEEDYQDYRRDQYLSDLYEEYGPEWAQEHATELNAQAIKQFTVERLQSAYLQRPDMARTAVGMLEQMERLLQQGNRLAALVFGASAIEITIRDLLLRPILSGIVHNEALADAVLKLTPNQVGSDTFRQLLFAVLDKVADVDLATYTRSGSGKSLWDEYRSVRKDRNELIHSGVAPSQQTLESFDVVAVEFLNVIFPRVLKSLELDATGYLMIYERGESMVPVETDDDLEEAAS